MARILVAEDDLFIALAYEAVLIAEGHEVHSCENGKLALAASSEFQPDLLLTDLVMPAMTGIELARALRGAPVRPDLPIVLVTAYPQEVLAAEPDLFDAVIRKPVSHEAVAACVDELLQDAGRRRATAQAAKRVAE